MREALLAGALQVRGQGAEAVSSPTPQLDAGAARFVGRGGQPAAVKDSARRGIGLRQMREWKAQRHAQQTANEQTADGVLANMSEPQNSNGWRIRSVRCSKT